MLCFASPQITLRIAVTCQGRSNPNALQVFLINLPVFSAHRFPLVMHFIVSTCHKLAGSRSNRSAAVDWAASLGPSLLECGHERCEPAYGASVAARAARSPNWIWDERIGLYQHGLMTAPWTRGADSTPDFSTKIEDTHDSQIKCYTTVVFGLKDQALNHRIAVDSIEDFISPQANGGSKGLVITMDNVGHWSPLHPLGSRIMEELLLQHVRTGDLHDILQANNMANDMPLFAVSNGIHLRRLK